MVAAVEGMSQEELVSELTALRAELDRRAADEPKGRKLLQELELHQQELEAQNRELRRAQQQLEDSRNRYAELYDFAPVGYCTLDGGGVIEELNLTAGAMLGYDRGWLVGTPLSVALPPDQRPGFFTFLADCATRGGEAVLEATFAGRPGAPGMVQLVATPRRGPEGAARGYLMAITDIAERKVLEARLRFLADVSELVGSRTDLEGTLANVARLAVPFLADVCFVDLLDERGEIRRLDAVLSEVPAPADLGETLKRASLADSRSPQARVIDSSHPVLFPALAALAAELGHEHPLVFALGSAGVTSLMVVPLVARGQTLGALTFGTCRAGRPYATADLAFAQELARRAAMGVDNARLLAVHQRNTRAREDLLSVVSHDLKAPLTVIQLSIASVLRGRTEAADRRLHGRRELRRIHQASERMTVLINDLLDAATIEAGRFAVDAGRAQVRPLLVDAVEQLAPVAAAKKVSLELDCGECPDVVADGGRIQQVLANLIGNAIKFTPGGGTVTVGAEPAADFVRVWVRDTGPGIAPEDAEHVFDRFWKAKRGLRTGSGLGLFIAQGIVAAHGGRIWVDTQPPPGSEFSFTLPVASADTAWVRAPLISVLHGEAPAGAPRAGEPPGHGLEPAGRKPTRSWLDREHLDIVAHELRSAAMSVQLQLEKLSSPHAEALRAGQAECLKRATAALARLNVAIETTLQQAMLDYGALRPLARPFDVVEVATVLAELFRPMAERKEISVRISADRNSRRRLESDPDLVRLMLTQLLLNALRRSPRGVVELSVADRRAEWRIAVRDSGPLLSDSARIEAFEVSPGAGPGLALVRNLALALGGHVDVASVRSRGSSFSFTLPAKFPAPSRGPAGRAR